MSVEKNKMATTKAKWFTLLLLAIACFVVGLVTGRLIFNLMAIALAVYIYKYGSSVMFAEYDEKQRQRKEETIILQEAAKEVLSSGQFLKKKNRGNEYV